MRADDTDADDGKDEVEEEDERPTFVVDVAPPCMY